LWPPLFAKCAKDRAPIFVQMPGKAGPFGKLFDCARASLRAGSGGLYL
jgi:hypothetical protein